MVVPAVRDLLAVIGEATDLNQAHDLIAKFFLVQGVKIGGIYQHFKGVKYEVTGVGRDSSNWDAYLVSYFELSDPSHKASRPVAEFLEDVDKPEYKGPRFKLIR